ncbi:MAG: hypothetical protein MUE36_10520 [Acidimicrobiales bacterium]|nr:hypothetical protein [Acidimicrobiales bacterium]
MGFILLAIAMIIPVIALVFILRTLATIVDGLRSVPYRRDCVTPPGTSRMPGTAARAQSVLRAVNYIWECARLASEKMRRGIKDVEQGRGATSADEGSGG